LSRAKVIKAAQKGSHGSARRAPPEGTRVVRVGQQRSALDSEVGLAQAREVAAQILREAEEDANALRAAKIAEGEKEAVALVIHARREAHRVVAEARGGLQNLALAAARKILDSELTLRPEAIEGVVAGVIAVAGQARRLRIRVHPEELSILESAHTRLTKTEGQLLEFVADADISQGGCVLESESGEIDGRLETQLAALAEVLLDEGAKP